jgi:hypothetical protein
VLVLKVVMRSDQKSSLKGATPSAWMRRSLSPISQFLGLPGTLLQITNHNQERGESAKAQHDTQLQLQLSFQHLHSVLTLLKLAPVQRWVFLQIATGVAGTAYNTWTQTQPTQQQKKQQQNT